MASTTWLAFFLLVLVALQEGVLEAYPTGGPLSICNDPYPHHGGTFRLKKPTPFRLSLSATEYSPGDIITVTITSTTTDKIKGFQIAAHSTFGRWDRLFGEFLTYPQHSSPYIYYSNVTNCVSHGKKFTKTRQVIFTWKAPEVSVGDLIFSATVVKHFTKFWVNHTAVLTAKSPAQPNVVAPPLQTETGDFMPQLNLDKCGTESGCVTHPKDCSADDCNFAISYFPVVGGIRFRLLNKQAKSLQSYVGMGISSDQKMTHDETFICMDIAGALDFAHGYNPAYYNIKVQSDEVFDIAIQSVDGAISCEFTRKLKGNFTYYGHKGLANFIVDYTHSLQMAEHYIYLTWGVPYEGAKETVLKHIQLPMVSQSKVAFNKKSRTKFYYLHDTVKLHATFMVLAWSGVISIAIIISRYYKDGFISTNDMICGAKAWFQIHKWLALLAALFTSAGFISIYIRVMGLEKKELLHAGCGVAVMILTVVQVVMGLARPDGDAGTKRIVFNLMHRLTAIVVYVLAAATMMIGANIHYMSETMKTAGKGIVGGLFGFQIFAIFVLEIRKRCTAPRDFEDAQQIRKNDDQGVPLYDSMGFDDTGRRTPHSAPHTKSTALFVAYVMTMLLLLASFLTVLWREF